MRGWKPHLANFPAEIGERALRFQQGSHDLRIDAFLRVFAIHANPETAHAIANPVQTIGNRSPQSGWVARVSTCDDAPVGAKVV
jgi:hypothetical protein